MTKSLKVLSVPFALALMVTTLAAAQPIDIGSRLELMVDDYLIESQRDAELRLHPPTPREVAIIHNAPWEGNACAYSGHSSRALRKELPAGESIHIYTEPPE